MSGPLVGLKVLELAGIGPSPYACMLLADLGADVLRIERGSADAEATETWDLLNRSRYSVAVDLKSSAGRGLVLELCEQAEVLIEGFRPGVTERLGLGPDEVFSRNPQLVYGRMTGYGQIGPLSQHSGHDINYIAVSGALWPIGRRDQPPVPPLNFVGDFGGGALFLVFGVLAAVLSARSSGVGQVVDASMVDGSASIMAMTHSLLNNGYWQEERGVNFLDGGAPFYDVYATKDAKFVAVGAIESKFYSNLVRGLDLDPAALPPQFDRATWPDVKERFSALFITKTRDEWTDHFADLDACVSPVLSPREAVRHPFNTARDVFVTDGVIQPQPAPRFSKTPGQIRQPPQQPGSGTRDGLVSWGISDERQALLRSAGAFF